MSVQSPPNVSRSARAIIRRLGLDPGWVQQITIRPDSIEATVYLKNDDGEKYVDKWTQQPAVETLTFEVKA